jgi:DNA-binding protein HU-beta
VEAKQAAKSKPEECILPACAGNAGLTQTERSDNMAKAKTKSQIIGDVAAAVEISKKQAKAAIEALVALAYKGAKDGFTIPGLGKLVKVNRKARMGRNPATGEAISIPAKTVLKFRIAKAAKDAVLKG